MREVTKEMIQDYKIRKLGYDFMGYAVNSRSPLSFHHLIIAHRNSRKMGIGEGYLRWNGAILVQNTSHDYLHVIERLDDDIFFLITSEMIEENMRGKLDVDSIRRIHGLLDYFEREHINDRNSKGKRLIKDLYVNRPKF